MGTDKLPPNLPSAIVDAVASVPKSLVPSAVKALDRLLGAAIDVPVAWLEQRASRIYSQTESYRLVEAAIASRVASEAGSDPETVVRAMNVLIRKEYRKQANREAVAAAMIEDLRGSPSVSVDAERSGAMAELDEDWLNVFERFAEDASSERLQDLWGRVLAGEIRKPGQFSSRTLRFLSEFSQADAQLFEEFSKSAFCDVAPVHMVKPKDNKDIRKLVHLEATGLIQGASGIGLQRNLSFDHKGYAIVSEGDLAIVFKREPGTSISQEIVLLTPLGQELLSLVPTRDLKVVARAVASGMRVHEIYECYLGKVLSSHEESLKVDFTEIVWHKEESDTHIMEGPAI